jgi:hypothetical protein
VKFDHRGVYQIGEVLVPELHRRYVGASLEHDLLIGRKCLVHIYLQPVEITERRHGAQFAIREQTFKLLLGG